MTEHRPYTKAERKDIVQLAANECLLYGDNYVERHAIAHQMLRFDATVEERDWQIVALHAEIARLRPDAETGVAVEAMAAYDFLGYVHGQGGNVWLVRRQSGISPMVSNTIAKGPSALAVLRALAALRAAKGDFCQ